MFHNFLCIVCWVFPNWIIGRIRVVQNRELAISSPVRAVISQEKKLLSTFSKKCN